MPTYEMPLLIRLMGKTELKATLKRTAQMIFNRGGFIRKIESLGEKETPYKMASHERIHRRANYFILYFDIPPLDLITLQEDCNRDTHIIKSHIVKQEEEKNAPCTIHEDLLPPPYRPNVQKLLKIAEKQELKKDKSKFRPNTGLSYYPFQR